MYCLSKDGLRMTEARGFNVAKMECCFRYFRNGEFKYNKPGETLYCIFTNNGCFMDAFNNEKEAREKLREVMYAAAAGMESFEF